jgi:hypothetical protein
LGGGLGVWVARARGGSRDQGLTAGVAAASQTGAQPTALFV